MALIMDTVETSKRGHARFNSSSMDFRGINMSDIKVFVGVDFDLYKKTQGKKLIITSVEMEPTGNKSLDFKLIDEIYRRLRDERH